MPNLIEKMSRMTFGVELEVILPRLEVEPIITGLITKQSISPGWKVVDDTSVEGALGDGCEVVSPILSLSTEREVDVVCKALTRWLEQHTPYKAVNRTCGLHVHIGALNMEVKDIIALERWWMLYQELFICAFGTLKHRLEYYSKRAKGYAARMERDIKHEEFVKEFYAYYNHMDGAMTARRKYARPRYSTLNIHSVLYRGTVEFRLFNGTINPSKIGAYVRFCMAAVIKARECKCAKNKSGATQDAVAGIDNLKYRMRCVLLKLGFVGDEWKDVREVLLSRVKGDAAYKGGRITKKDISEITE